VQGQKLQGRQQGDLLVASSQGPMTDQPDQQRGRARLHRVAVTPAPGVGQGGLGRLHVEQLQRVGRLQVKRPSGDHHQVGDL
jgi:hypothetical protein